MNKSYQFIPSSIDEIKLLETAWIQSLNNTHDDMWLNFAHSATNYLIISQGHEIGFASVDGESRLLRFYLIPSELHHSEACAAALVSDLDVRKAVISSAEPIGLSAMISIQKRVSVHSYLFEHQISGVLPQIDGQVHRASLEELDAICDYFHENMGASLEWLNGYVTDRISLDELYVFNIENQIAGTFEVRQHCYNAEVVELGMVVAKGHRRKGLGSYLLHLVTQKALELGKRPICSCEADNAGSYKAIISNGFRSKYQMLEFEF